MSDFLANLAALRSEYNQGEGDIVKQFMPLVGYAIKQLQGEFVSEAELQDVIYNTMQFRIPLGAIRLFINRAANRRYAFITKNPDGTYSPNRNAIANVKFSERRAEAVKHQAALKASFREFCTKTFEATPTGEEIEQHFFEILFDIAPQVMRSLADPLKHLLEFGETSETTLRYRIYCFVAHCVQADNEDLRYIEEFIHGAILAESFFYTTPADVFQKMKDVRVFLDTSLLISAIGLAEDAEVRAVRELLDLLRLLKAKVRCFDDTRGELHGIIYAIDQAVWTQKSISRRPGDVGDIMIRKGYDAADIRVLLEDLNGELAEQGIMVEKRPSVVEDEELGIDEATLTSQLVAEFSKSNAAMSGDPLWLTFSAERRAKHDVDCLAAIFRLRGGRARQSLERCEALFVTSNTALVRTAGTFFEDVFKEGGEASQVPLCLASNVFTMLMWLKATDRKPALTKDRLVANSIAAMNPSPELWAEFVRTLRKLMDRGELTRAEFDYIANAMETRTILMTQTEGDPGAITEGTTLDIKTKVMRRLLGEKDAEIAELKSTVATLVQRDNERRLQVERRVKRAEELAQRAAVRLVQILIVLPFVALLAMDVWHLARAGEETAFDYIRASMLAIATLVAGWATIYVPPVERFIAAVGRRTATRVGRFVRIIIG